MSWVGCLNLRSMRVGCLKHCGSRHSGPTHKMLTTYSKRSVIEGIHVFDYRTWWCALDAWIFTAPISSVQYAFDSWPGMCGVLWYLLDKFAMPTKRYISLGCGDKVHPILRGVVIIFHALPRALYHCMSIASIYGMWLSQTCVGRVWLLNANWVGCLNFGGSNF